MQATGSISVAALHSHHITTPAPHNEMEQFNTIVTACISRVSLRTLSLHYAKGQSEANNCLWDVTCVWCTTRLFCTEREPSLSLSRSFISVRSSEAPDQTSEHLPAPWVVGRLFRVECSELIIKRIRAIASRYCCSLGQVWPYSSLTRS